MSQMIVNFYFFKSLSDLPEMKQRWKQWAQSHGLLGTILLAPEGVNCALSGPKDGLEQFVGLAQGELGVDNLCPKWSVAAFLPFKRLKVKVKRWIIRFAEASDPTIDAIHKAPRLKPLEVHRELAAGREDLIIVDTRNSYETEVGAFSGAVQLPIRTFTEFPEAFLSRFSQDKDKTFLFYCTGGVRCEKVVPWAIAHGFKNSTQIDGGILKYFEEVGAEHYEQGCFVFDERIAVASDLNPV